MTKKDALRTSPGECNYSFFSHTACEFFPCHKTDRPEDFNCLFCYCPLYALGDRCGGAFAYTEKGIKDCSRCLVPHNRESYARIIARFGDLSAIASQNRGGEVAPRSE